MSGNDLKLELPSEEVFSTLVCMARNEWQKEVGSKHDLEFDYAPGEHPDDWMGKYIRDHLLLFMIHGS